jgi:hypothetical protein
MKTRVGRPQLKASEKRDRGVRFMVTKEELALLRIKAKAARLTLSEYLRRAALGD